jgi:hypothetical protein
MFSPLHHDWRNVLLPEAVVQSKLDSKSTAFYQLGVFSGNSMRQNYRIFRYLNKALAAGYGFDVFTGMPKETAEPIWQDSWNPDINPDDFNIISNSNLDKYMISSVDDHVNILKLDLYGISPETETNIFVGLVEDTLPPLDNLLPAFYIDVDFDIYSPTKFALETLIEKELIIPETLIGYDDWGGTPDFNDFKYGESRAHKEIVEEFGISMKRLGQVGNEFPHVQTLWRVESIG